MSVHAHTVATKSHVQNAVAATLGELDWHRTSGGDLLSGGILSSGGDLSSLSASMHALTFLDQFRDGIPHEDVRPRVEIGVPKPVHHGVCAV